MTPNIEISTVVGCKMGCDYCPQKLHTTGYRGNKQMLFEEYVEMLDKIPKHVEIYFAGMAEPWLNQDMGAMLASTYHAGYKIGMYTTCEGMSLEDAEILVSMNIPFVHFCLHLPDADGLMKFNVTDEYLSVLKECMKIPNHNFTCIGKVHPLVEAITGPVPDSSNTLISRGGNIKMLAITPKKGRLKCSAMSDKMDHNILLPNGDVLLCCCDYSRKHVLGNLLKDSYEDLFNSEEYNRIKQGLNDDNSNIICRTCELSILNPDHS